MSTRIKVFPFSCVCAYACVSVATNEDEIPLRRNTSTRIFTTRVYVWSMKTLNQDYLGPNQFSKMMEGSDDFSCSFICMRRILFSCSFVLTLVVALVLTSLVKTFFTVH